MGLHTVAIARAIGALHGWNASLDTELGEKRRGSVRDVGGGVKTHRELNERPGRADNGQRRPRQAAKDHGRAVDLLLADTPDERRSDADEASCTVATFQLRIATGQLDLHVFGADRRGTFGVPRLERIHECLGGFQWIGH